jgi:indolepyruvate ferredoxin oxidoreductase alpha subunit
MKQILLGNEAFARGAYEAGVRVAAAYPGTPSTEITENISKYKEVYAEWSPNEKVALEVAIGASIGGARAMACMKHVGLNVAADPLFTASYTGVNGGLVIVVADDQGMHSSQNEQDSRCYARAAHVPMLEPSDSMEAKEFMQQAFDLSEKFDTPVLVRSSTRVSHSRGLVTVEDRQDIPLREYNKDIKKYVMMPGMARGRHMVVEQRETKMESFADTFKLNRVEMGDTKIGVITSGIPYTYVKEALPEASVLKLGMVNPLPKQLIAEFASKVGKLYIVEELEPFFEEQIRAMGIACEGKSLFTRQGEYSVNMLREKILGEKAEFNEIEILPQRPPVLCAGCPHRGVFYTIKKLNLTVMGDIGCYTLGALPPLSAMDAVVCMGASIGMTMGMEKARKGDTARKTVAVIGDSTFIHSGITGLIDMVYNGGTSTVLILDNSTTGMTGHQNHPGTGRDIYGNVAPQLNLEKLCEALGIKNISVADPFNLKELEKILKKETQRESLSVVILRRPCLLLDSKNVKPPVKIEGCKNCGLCLKLGCPALIKGNGEVLVDETLCTGCGLCVKICPHNAIHARKAEKK